MNTIFRHPAATMAATAWLCVALCGCGGSADGDLSKRQALDDATGTPVAVLPIGDEVALKRVEGNFAEVETSAGQRLFVPKQGLARLEIPGEWRFVVCEPVVAYETPPPPGEPEPAADERPTVDELKQALKGLKQIRMTETSRQITQGPYRNESHLRFDPESGEICWPAHICLHPGCPHFAATGERYIFPWPDPLFERRADGSWGYGRLPPGMGPGDYVWHKFGTYSALCPKCLDVRDRDSESDRQRARYDALVRPYLTPELTKEKRQLERKLKAAAARRN